MNWYIDKYFECGNMKEFSHILRSGYRAQDKELVEEQVEKEEEEEEEEEDIEMYLPIL